MVLLRLFFLTKMVVEFLLWLCIAISAMFLVLTIKFLFKGDKDLKKSFYGFVAFAVAAFFLYLSNEIVEKQNHNDESPSRVETAK